MKINGSLNYIKLLLLLTGFLIASCDNESRSRGEYTDVKLNIDWIAGPDYIGLYIADELGYFEKKHIDLTIIQGNGAETSALQLVEGGIDIGTTTVDALLRLVRNRDIPETSYPKIISVIFPTNPVVLISPYHEPMREIPSLDSDESRCPRLAENNISIEGCYRIGFSDTTSVTYAQFNYLLDQIKNPAVTLVQVSWDGPRRLSNGDIDAVLGYATDIPPELASIGYKYTLVPLSKLGINVAGQVLAFSAKTNLTDETIKSVNEAVIQGWEYTKRKTPQAARLFVSRFPEFEYEKTLNAIEETLDYLPVNYHKAPSNAYSSDETILEALQRTDKYITKSTKNMKQINYENFIP
ncbi:ABC-type nitrate/sulfonate/bicarbonate transport system, substrate-binding protein [Nitrosomonas marina]|uniref:ABC-type nitrate/sulfonate/bicarbonate transport system, substrate-binding protein n=1 Tax=Nitrosomonas marina TaxID=917 RepID=A0A1I0FUM4_9PROT|nr:ABC transporter substrate-binding protein [Nitrosomonas marina]SET61937.1 ABC-type nitrate/sulfonate/bicarbonate transport system, substrate-binding protein [Nitrosomonas marina]